METSDNSSSSESRISASMDTNKSKLEEHEPLSHLLGVLPQKAQRGLTSLTIDYTCLDASPQYIALGTSVGLVLLYDRLSRSLQRLNCKIKTEVITCIRMAESVDYVVAAGTLSGNVFVFQLPSVLPGRAKRMQLYCVSGVHFSKITCVEWSQNTLKLFSGDQGGCVACTEMDYGQHQSKSYIVAEEPHEIVQLDYSFKRLLVSTTFRSIVCTPGVNEKHRLGSKDRKMLGSFAACFKPELCRLEDATIFATRPGLRLWKVDIEGNVQATYMFKDLLGGNTPVIEVLPDTGHGHSTSTIEDKTFGLIKIFAESKLVTWHEGTLFVLNPENGTFEGWHSNIGIIKDLAVCQDEIFILRDAPGKRKVIRISRQRDALNEQVHYKHSGLPTNSVAAQSSPSPVHRLQQTASNLADAILGVGEKIKGVQEGHTPPWGLAGDPNAPSSPDVDSCKEVNSQSSGSSSVTSPEKEKPPGQPTIILDSPDTLTVILQDLASNKDKQLKVGKVDISDKMKSSEPQGKESNIRPSSSDGIKADRLSNTNMASAQDDGIVFSRRKGKKKRGKSDKDTESISSYDSLNVTLKSEAEPLEDSPVVIDSPQVLRQSASDEMWHKLDKWSVSGLKLDSPEHPTSGTVGYTGSTEEDKDTSPIQETETNTSAVSAVLSQEQKVDTDSTENAQMMKPVKNTPQGKSKSKKEEDSSQFSDFIDRLINDNKNTQPKTNKKVESNNKDSQFLSEVTSISKDKNIKDDSFVDQNSPIKDVSVQKDACKPTSKATASKPEEPKHIYTTADSSTDDFYSMFKRANSIVSPGWSPDGEDEPSIEDALERNDASFVPENRSKKDVRQTLSDTWTEFLAPGNLVSLCLTSRHIWCVDKSDRLHYSGLSGPGLKWRKVDEPAKQISISRSGWIVWRLYNGSAYAGTAITTRAPAGMKWVEAARDVAYVNVDNTVAWYIKNNGDVLVQKNLSRQRPSFRAVKVQCQINLLEIVCQDNVVWGLTEARTVLVRTGIKVGTEEGTGWTPLGSREGANLLVSSISLGDNDTAWVVDVVGRVYFTTGVTCDNPTGTGHWWQISLSEYLMDDYKAIDALKSIAAFPQNLSKILAKEEGGLITVGSNGIWICPGRKHVLHVCRGGITGHRFNVVVPTGMATSALWQNISAGAVDNNEGLIWAQQPNNAIFCFPVETKKFSEVSQPDTSTPFVCISSAKEAVWGLLGDGQVVIRSGMAAHCPRGLNWRKLDLIQLGSAKLKHLSCSHEGVWAVDDNGMMYLRMGIKPPGRGDTGYLSPAWVPVDGTAQGIGARFVQVFAGPTDWMVWALDNKRQVYARKGISDAMPIGTHWSYIPGTSAEKLCLSERYVYALNTNDEVLVRFGISAENPGGNYWKKVPGAFKSITVTAQDELYGINIEGQLCKRTVYYLQRQDVLEELGNSPTQKDGVTDDWELI